MDHRENIEAITSYVGGRLREVIQEGYPEVGWPGDPLVYPVFDRENDRWLIVDGIDNKPFMTKDREGLIDLDVIPDICSRLRDARVERGNGVLTKADRILARNKAIEDARMDASKAHNIEVARALYDTSKHRKTFV